MRKLHILLFAALLSAGCSTSTMRTSAPAGPVQTNTTERGLIPAGTTFAVRTNETISTETAGNSYSAQVAQDVVDQNDRILIPRGSNAELTVVDSSSGGAVGTKTMELAVRSVTVNGKRYNVQTDTETARGNEGIGANRRTAEMVGGAAALGTLIGAVAGGGKGAAIGAAVGAAGGATAQVLTRGKEVRVPAETVLSFRLDQPLRLQG